MTRDDDELSWDDIRARSEKFQQERAEKEATDAAAEGDEPHPGGPIDPSTELRFEGEVETILAGDVLIDLERWKGKTLIGPCKGTLTIKPSGLAEIVREDGSADAYLVADRELLERAINATEDADAAMAILARLAPIAIMTPTGIDAVIAATALRFRNIGKRAIKQQIGKSWGAALPDQPKAARAPSGFSDGRVPIDAPPAAGELTPTLLQVDNALCGVKDIEPPFRDRDGRLACIRERVPSSLHLLLTDEEQAATDAEGETSRIPAPPIAAIVPMTYFDGAMLIERHCRMQRETAKGETYPIRIPEPFGNAYLAWQDSKLPRATALVTLPLVLRKRKLLAGTGLDADHGLIFRIPPGLIEAMPDPADCTLDYAIMALNWLMDEWLCDVTATPIGKACIIAILLQTIERFLLGERPAWILDAGQRGGGKTTTAIMIALAVSGIRPGATQWADNAEERRKAYFAALLDGPPLVVFDNIPRGTNIRCPTIEAALTMAEMTGRLLGFSRTGTASTSPTTIFTGNGIHPVGDMTSRCFRVSLEVDRPDPENRPFRHPDPVGWTLDHRGKILNAAYAILMVDRQQGEPAATRFKAWHQLVGGPLETVFNAWAEKAECDERLDFAQLLQEGEEDDDEAEGALDLFLALEQAAEGKPFTASLLARLLEFPAKFDPINGDWDRHIEERDRVNSLRGSLAAALGKSRIEGRIIPQEAGYFLKALEKRNVADGDDVLSLRRSEHKRADGRSKGAIFSVRRQKP